MDWIKDALRRGCERALEAWHWFYATCIGLIVTFPEWVFGALAVLVIGHLVRG